MFLHGEKLQHKSNRIFVNIRKAMELFPGASFVCSHDQNETQDSDDTARASGRP